MFAVLVTGPPGAGKTATLTALHDALAEDGIAHAAADVDEIAWSFPFPDHASRCRHLRAWRDAHARAGATLFLVAEVIESRAELDDLLEALGADDHLLVRLHAGAATLQERIVAREPEGWFGLDRLLAEADRLQVSMSSLTDVHVVLDTERLTPREVAESIRAARGDLLGGAV